MNLRFILYFWMVVALTAFEPALGPPSIIAAEKTAPVLEEDVRVLASGPIHEAFAEAVVLDPKPGITAPKAPPALIEEIPPEHKPEGDVQWIPGYWAWDDERNEYIWVSGIWRVPPPGQQWIPGYWTSTGKGYQWISGYWAGNETKETVYLPEPPESVEVGPSSHAPSPDFTWMPGYWVWQYGHYAWRPGYWAPVQPDWIWVPDHYNWTPRGYIFVGGYWDYTLIHRGVLFAPVFFTPRVYPGLTFSFSPVSVIDLNVFDDALFLRPRYHHYYYGDYYAPRYYKKGIYPWFSLHARRVAYDPIYAHQRWSHRNDRKWENHLQARFRERREHDGLRTPRSYEHRARPNRTGGSSGPERLGFVMPPDRTWKTKARAYRFKPLSKKEIRKFSQREKKVRTYRKERQNRLIQRKKMPGKRVSRSPKPYNGNFSKSPTINRSYEKANRQKAPPARYKTLKKNHHVERLQRKYDVSQSWKKPPKSEIRGRKSEVRGQRSMGKVQKFRNKRGWSEGHMQRFNKRRQGGFAGRQRF